MHLLEHTRSLAAAAISNTRHLALCWWLNQQYYQLKSVRSGQKQSNKQKKSDCVLSKERESKNVGGFLEERKLEEEDFLTIW
jgi:hypothetical protein